MSLLKFEIILLLALVTVSQTNNAMDDKTKERQGSQAIEYGSESKKYNFLDIDSAGKFIEKRDCIDGAKKEHSYQENSGHCEKQNKLFENSENHMNYFKNEINFNNPNQYKEKSHILDTFSTSVWCHKSLESGLRCNFHNLCYLTHINEFAFILGSNSIIYGISNIKTISKELFISSLIGHNYFSFPMSLISAKDVPSNKRIINNKTLIMARFKPDNLLHIFHDDLLPAYFTIKEICNDNPVCKRNINIFLADKNDMTYWDLFKTVSDKIIVSSKLSKDETWLCFRESYVGLNKMSVWYQYGFDKPQGPILNENFFGHNLHEYVVHTQNKLGIYDTKEEIDLITCIILTRQKNRKIINEGEVFHEIKKTLTNFYNNEDIQIKIMSLEQNSIQEIIHEISHAKILVGMHGSALILGLFLSKDSMLVELWPYGVSPSAATVIRTLCGIKGITYTSWVNEDFQNTVTHTEYPPHYGGLDHMPKAHQEKLLRELQSSELTSVICCDDPNWLFRIYQDTKVLIDSKIKGLKSVPFYKVVLQSLEESEIHKNKEFSYISKLMFPSKVISVSCHIIKTSNKNLFNINWQAPWNLQHLGCSNMWYEVTHQNTDSDSGYDYSRSSNVGVTQVTTEVQITLELGVDIASMSVWITCVCDGESGPDVYVLCQ